MCYYDSRDNNRASTHSRFYCQQSYRIMINPYNQKIKSVNIIWTPFFVFISFFFNCTCSKIVSFCVIPSDKDLYLESGNDTFIIYNREGGRERKRQREKTVVSSSNTQQGKTQPLVNRHAPSKISYCTLKRERKRNKNTICTNKRHIFINRNLERSHVLFASQRVWLDNFFTPHS